MTTKALQAALFLTLLAAPLRAQTVTIDALRDELANDKDIAALRKREFDLNRKAASQSSALIERGMVLLRLHQLTRDDHDAKLARDMFERATKREPQNAQAYYGWALALAGGPGVRVPSPAGVLNGIVLAQSFAEIAKKDPISRAKANYKKALDLDPDLTGAAVELAHLAVDSRDKDNMKAAAVALRRLVGAERGGSAAATALSEVEAALGNVEAASSAAETATTLAVGSNDGDAAASASLARAVALLRQPGKEEMGGKAYFEGVSQLTDESAKAYFSGIAVIATDHEKQDWENKDLAGRKEWLKRFWSVRAAASGVTVGERLAEHYKRLAIAQERYRKQSKRSAASAASVVLRKNTENDLPFDDRGLIYVRHGAPEEVLHTSHSDLRPNETWVYKDQSGSNVLYHFVIMRDATDYVMTDDLLNAIDPSTGEFPIDAAVALLTPRQSYDPTYGKLLLKMEGFRANKQYASMFASIGQNDAASRAGGSLSETTASLNMMREQVRADTRATAMRGLTTDTDRPDFKTDLPFYYDLYAFKGKNGLTDITAAAAVPGTSLFSQRRGGQYIYSLQASLIFIDTVTNEITRKDTTFNYWSNRVLGEYEHLRLAMNMTVPFSKAGMHRIVLRDLIDPGAGQLYGGPSELKNFAGQSLMISDIVLAESDEGLWERGLAKLRLMPPRQFEEKTPLKVFYELYNMPADTRYQTEISMTPVEGITGFGRLKKLLGGTDGAIHLSFDGTAQPNADGTVQELRQVTTEVKPGKYRIDVRVTNLENQQSVRTETMFLVSAKKK